MVDEGSQNIMGQEYAAQKIKAVDNLRVILEQGGVIRTEKYQLCFMPESHPLDETWGYQITDAFGNVDKRFGYNLESALFCLKGLVSQTEISDDEIPF